MVEDLLLLGIDTSGKTASAAIYDTENEVFLAQSTMYTQKTHSQVIMPICKEIIAQSGKEMRDIGGIAVANGPGSYTGLRIGAAAVKAMCFALDCKCCGISTLKGLAYNNLQFNGVIGSVIKARGELVYACAYKSDGRSLEQICSEKIIDQSEFAEYLKSLDEDVLICGSEAIEFTSNFEFILAPPVSRLQNAAGICLAASKEKFQTPDLLEVSYLQKVKAEKDLEKRTEKI